MGPVYEPLTVFRVATGYSYTLSTSSDGRVLDKHGEVQVSRAAGMSTVLVITEQKLQHRTSVSDGGEVRRQGSGLCLLHQERRTGRVLCETGIGANWRHAMSQ